MWEVMFENKKPSPNGKNPKQMLVYVDNGPQEKHCEELEPCGRGWMVHSRERCAGYGYCVKGRAQYLTRWAVDSTRPTKTPHRTVYCVHRRVHSKLRIRKFQDVATVAQMLSKRFWGKTLSSRSQIVIGGGEDLDAAGCTSGRRRPSCCIQGSSELARLEFQPPRPTPGFSPAMGQSKWAGRLRMAWMPQQDDGDEGAPRPAGGQPGAEVRVSRQGSPRLWRR